MNISRAERQQIENEMIFRRFNEKVSEELGKLDAMHVEDGNAELTKDSDHVLEFVCECSDEDCTTRIPMRLTKYQQIHQERDTFIIAPGHQASAIEKVVREETDHAIVEKNNSISESNNSLNSTSVYNN